MRSYPDYFVTQTVKVTGMVCHECATIVTEALLALDGVEKVQSHWQKNRLTMTYDLNRVTIQKVEKLLADIGYPADPGFFQRKKRDWIRFAEQNALDIVKHVQPCCSKPPVGSGLKR